MNPALRLEGIDFSYEENEADLILDGIDLSVPSGQFVTLLGASGSGKSTLLRLIAGLQLPKRGRIS